MYLALDALFMIELKGKTIEWTQPLSIPVLPENRIQEILRAERRGYRCITAPNCTLIHIKAQLLQPEHRDCFNSIMIV